jgi:hypothetical protein
MILKNVFVIELEWLSARKYYLYVNNQNVRVFNECSSETSMY